MDSSGYQAAVEICKAYSLSQPDVLPLIPPREASESEIQRWSQSIDKMFGLLMTTALFPGAARPISDAQRVINRQNRLIRSVKRISFVLTVLGGLSYLAYLAISRKSNKGKIQNSTEEELV